MASIYRKYRPKTFAEMVGQNHIKLTLQNELETDASVHAYLFCGPRGLGKTTAARLFAKAVNCENRKKGSSEPCNKCSSCTEVNQAKSLDVMEIDAASHTGVDNVRENIIENIRFKPNKSKFKVFIIDEVHMLSISAFNALLKTLEEPPAHALFVLCTTEIHKVPDTIISRCQRFDFKKVGSSEMIKRLKRIVTSEKVKIDDEIFNIIAGKSDGCMRDAEKLLGQVLSLGGDHITKQQVQLVLPSNDVQVAVDFIELITQNKAGQAIDFVNNLVEDGVDLEIFSKEVIEFLRKMILIQSGVKKSEFLGMSKSVHKTAGTILESITILRLAEITAVMMSATRELKTSEIVQLPLELAVIKLCREDLASAETVQIIKPKEINIDKGKKQPKSDTTDDQDKKVVPKKTESANFDKIKSSWPKIIIESHKKSRDLLFINESLVWPIELSGNELKVGFKFDIHKIRFDKNGNPDIFAKAIMDITSNDVSVRSKTLKPSELAELEIEQENIQAAGDKMSGVKVTEDNILDSVLDSFGGEVVEE